MAGAPALSERLTQLAQAAQPKGLTTEERQALEAKQAKEDARLLREKNARAVQRQAANKSAAKENRSEQENTIRKVSDTKVGNVRPSTPVVPRLGGSLKSNTTS